MARPDPDVLRAAAAAVPPEGVRLKTLLELAPGGRLPAMIVLCTLPAALPGLQLGWVCVPALLYLALAMWRGDPEPAMPARVTQAMVSQKAAARLLQCCAWLAERSGRHLRTTWPRLVRSTRRKPAALLVALMALTILLPLPGSNMVPALAIVVLMGGIVWRDGRAVIASMFLAALGIAIVVALPWLALTWFAN